MNEIIEIIYILIKLNLPDDIIKYIISFHNCFAELLFIFKYLLKENIINDYHNHIFFRYILKYCLSREYKVRLSYYLKSFDRKRIDLLLDIEEKRIFNLLGKQHVLHSKNFLEVHYLIIYSTSSTRHRSRNDQRNNSDKFNYHYFVIFEVFYKINDELIYFNFEFRNTIYFLIYSPIRNKYYLAFNRVHYHCEDKNNELITNEISFDTIMFEISSNMIDSIEFMYYLKNNLDRIKLNNVNITNTNLLIKKIINEYIEHKKLNILTDFLYLIKNI